MKKAFVWLEENGIAYTFHDYKSKGITAEKITKWLSVHPLESLINQKGTTFKQLSEAEKISTTKTDKAIELMIQKTSMIKRPIVETGNEVLVGFNPDFWDKHL
jgi:arsenate reductase (glutaredoxin)